MKRDDLLELLAPVADGLVNDDDRKALAMIAFGYMAGLAQQCGCSIDDLHIAMRAIALNAAVAEKCAACGVPMPEVKPEPGREWLCPRCFSALTPDERRRGVVKRASDPPTPRSTPAAKKLKGRT